MSGKLNKVKGGCYICNRPFCLVPTEEGNLICLHCAKKLGELDEQLETV